MTAAAATLFNYQMPVIKDEYLCRKILRADHSPSFLYSSQFLNLFSLSFFLLFSVFLSSLFFHFLNFLSHFIFYISSSSLLLFEVFSYFLLSLPFMSITLTSFSFTFLLLLLLNTILFKSFPFSFPTFIPSLHIILFIPFFHSFLKLFQVYSVFAHLDSLLLFASIQI
ncbi:unnamed protein product [Acanthosepion pharaonis]|uniref:Uncharacterized protein n=1 Tax=Acanthosepion pharaonis TaxID=158019 RepID=A0A812DHG9_ACAPH|nr:unnamed protein product [Sepia pharaonis]